MPISLPMRARLRGEKGFGLIELLMAMTMLSIGIFYSALAWSGIAARTSEMIFR